MCLFVVLFIVFQREHSTSRGHQEADVWKLRAAVCSIRASLVLHQGEELCRRQALLAQSEQ